jgi:hypothetical protein
MPTEISAAEVAARDWTAEHPRDGELPARGGVQLRRRWIAHKWGSAGDARAIGPIGTASRVLVGLLALYLALIDGPPFAGDFEWSLAWSDAALGFVLLPGAAIAFGLLARRRGTAALRLNGPVPMALNCLLIIALVANPYTAGGALLFYGATMLIAAARGQTGCEATVVSNWLLGRHDQVGCPTFSPIDTAESEIRGRAAKASMG